MDANEKEVLKAKLFTKVKGEVVKHLNAISNQDVNVPLSKVSSISVKELALEVEAESEIGIEYMIAWIESESIINDFRRAKVG